ncbi:MAG TPA: DUF1553 domain-containing protein, partial [Verrucomicrobiales bacterium]|nr:DUF1553 domain-containing protein [Verrucomicrobiales bacterium]
DGSLHRSVYLPVVRDRLPDVLDLFDFAEPGLVTGNRDTTNVPMQALYLMNSPFVREQAGAFAKRLGDFSPDLEDRIRQGFYMAFGRGPDDSEHTRIREFLSRLPDGSAGCRGPALSGPPVFGRVSQSRLIPRIISSCLCRITHLCPS